MTENEKAERKTGESHAPAGDLPEEMRESSTPSLEGLDKKNPDLNVKIILVIGPAGAGKTSLLKLLTGLDLNIGHTLDHGTAIPTEIPGTINGEPYIFIDSPGFGYAASKPGVIKQQIHTMLGFFTRKLGGIHGILYVQDITVDRTMPGMQEATEFLEELATRPLRPQITFITTKWDIPLSVPKLMRKCEAKEAHLKESTWAKFNIGAPDGSRYFRHGVDCGEDSQEAQQQGRDALLHNVMAHYLDASVEKLTMPFSEWTHLQQGFKIATVTGKVILIGGAMTLGAFIAACIGYVITTQPATIGVFVGAGTVGFGIYF